MNFPRPVSDPEWDEVLEDFRALGGVAENIRMDSDQAGLAAHDPVRPIVLRVPDNLLFQPEMLEFTEGSLRLKDRENVSSAARNFFQAYERVFGPTIFARAAAAITALDLLPPPAKDVLSRDFGMRLEGDRARRIETRFIESRAIWRGAGQVIAPVLELVKHDPHGLAIEHDHGMRIAGATRDGLRVFHPFHDALAIFERFGFAAAQPAAFSLPMSFLSNEIEISIGRNLHLGERQGQTAVPQLNVVARDRLALSHLLLGHSRFPRLARGIFRARMREADMKDPDGEFDRIVQENTARLLKLLGVLEGQVGETILTLRRMARHQLEAMSWSIGAREI